MEEKEKFKNPKLQKLYEVLCEIFPDRTGWQDIGEDGEYIAFVIDVKDNFNDGTVVEETLWINADTVEIFPEHLPEQDTKGYTVFAFES
jgi:hypothetical protein